MKKFLILIALATAPVLAPHAETKVEAAPAVVSPSDDTAATLKKILRKLEDIETRLDKIERAQTAESGVKRKIDTMERDLGDVRRSVQRLESKR